MTCRVHRNIVLGLGDSEQDAGGVVLTTVALRGGGTSSGGTGTTLRGSGSGGAIVKEFEVHAESIV